jgi:hypothetical protein
MRKIMPKLIGIFLAIEWLSRALAAAIRCGWGRARRGFSNLREQNVWRLSLKQP